MASPVQISIFTTRPTAESITLKVCPVTRSLGQSVKRSISASSLLPMGRLVVATTTLVIAACG